MGWKLMCSIEGLNPQTLAAMLQTNIQNCTNAQRKYAHAFILVAPTKAFLATDKNLTLAEYSSQKSSVGTIAKPIVAGPVAGYFVWNTAWAVEVAQGAQELDVSLLTSYGADYAAVASAANAKKYPNDCLGYCVNVLRKMTGLATVAGLTGA